MKRLALFALLVSLTAAPFAKAETYPWTAEGTILIPGPTGKVIGGMTELLNPCGAEDPDLGDLQGVDGYWITLPEDAGGHPATLDSDAVDADVWFYNNGCGLVTDDADPIAYDMATDATADEAGTIPLAASFAIVDNSLGVNVSFTFTIGPLEG
jgi:hypothetical protein